jgi:phytoene/squalene synthetase
MDTEQRMNSGRGLASSAALARAITRRASAQTYLTIRLLVDRGRSDDAYRAYAYFRWVDDVLDAPTHDRAARLQFLSRQKQLLEGLLAGMTPANLVPEEQMLADVLAGRRDLHPGLRSYLERMMAVMEFDAGRRGRLISGPELASYSQLLAGAVMDAIGYFIGHDHIYPDGAARLQAVIGAHVIHMLRDTADDLDAGYFNVPRAMLEGRRLTPSDIHHPAYRRWVRERVGEAHRCFGEGKGYLRRVGCLRALVAGWLYCARFEVVLRQIELDDYRLRSGYGRLPALRVWLDRLVRGYRTAIHGPRRTPTGSAGWSPPSL